MSDAHSDEHFMQHVRRYLLVFVALLIGTVIIIAVLTYFPAVSLGPIVEHYLMHSGKLFSMIWPPHGIWS